MAVKIRIAQTEDASFADLLSSWYEISSQERGTGIATRSAEYLIKKMESGNSVIALNGNELVGFCYIEHFDNKNYVSNSGLIVKKEYRGQNIAKKIKKVVFKLARTNFPNATIFGITTSEAVMRINSELGYRPVPLSKLTTDEVFWKGCQSCKNYNILMKNDKKMCLCTGMIAPAKNSKLKQLPWPLKKLF